MKVVQHDSIKSLKKEMRPLCQDMRNPVEPITQSPVF